MDDRHYNPARRAAKEQALLLVLCALHLLGGCSRTAEIPRGASRIGAVGLTTTRMNDYAAEQHAENWCWAASIQMALSAKDISVTQEEVVWRTFGQLRDRAGTPEDILANLNGWAITQGGKRVNVTAEYGTGQPPFELLKRQLQTGTPVIVGYHNPGFSIGHAVVVTAVIYETTAHGPAIQRVMVRDPWPDFNSQVRAIRVIDGETPVLDRVICGSGVASHQEA
jgi:hypothetical protein